MMVICLPCVLHPNRFARSDNLCFTQSHFRLLLHRRRVHHHADPVSSWFVLPVGVTHPFVLRFRHVQPHPGRVVVVAVPVVPAGELVPTRIPRRQQHMPDRYDVARAAIRAFVRVVCDLTSGPYACFCAFDCVCCSHANILTSVFLCLYVSVLCACARARVIIRLYVSGFLRLLLPGWHQHAGTVSRGHVQWVPYRPRGSRPVLQLHRGWVLPGVWRVNPRPVPVRPIQPSVRAVPVHCMRTLRCRVGVSLRGDVSGHH